MPVFTQLLSVELSAYCLGDVLQYFYPVLIRYGHDLIHFGRASLEIHDYDRFSVFRYLFLKINRVKAQCFVNIGEHRQRARLGYCVKI